jgi:hypothetical protein
MIIRIVGDDGKEEFPLIEKDDLQGKFDYKASVLPSIAGQQDIKKKQDMDLFQLLINLPFVDPQKLTQKILVDWNWSLDSVAKGEDQTQQAQPGAVGPDGQPMVGPDGQPVQAPPEAAGPAMPPGLPPMGPMSGGTQNIPPGVAKNALAMLQGGGQGGPLPRSSFAQANVPINLLNMGSLPPTAPGIPIPSNKRVQLPTTNLRGHNRGGKVNTNTSIHEINSNPESALMNRASSLQR